MKYYYQVEGGKRNNIGDVLQGMVAKAFLPEDALVADREALADMDKNRPALLIANGWYMHSFEKFPPPENVTPIYVSVHIAKPQLLASAKVRNHFKKHAPIGCRDLKTLNLFLGWGIPAYYSSCLTLTTQRRAPITEKGSGEILLVDGVDHPVPNEVKDKLEKLLGAPLIRVTHDPPDTDGSVEEYAYKAEKHMNNLLAHYCKVSLVVTTKIHCALPCLGMGVKVLFIHPNPDDPRLSTVSEFINILSYDDVLSSDKINVPKVKEDVLLERKKFLSYLVMSSIKEGHNILQAPSRTADMLLRLRSTLQALAYKIGIKGMYKLGISKKKISKFYGSGF